MSDALAARSPNQFGLVRLALALTVVLSHAPDLVDGDKAREPLFRITGYMSLGEVAVLGFFFISGVLVTASYAATADLAGFCRKRAARILPGFAVAYLVTLLVAGPLAGGHLDSLAGPQGFDALLRFLTLREPVLDGAFATAPHPRMNGSMWTIPYEARCYVLTAALGAAGLLRQPRACVWLACAAVLAVFLQQRLTLPPWVGDVIGDPRAAFRMLASFATGACFFVLRDRIVLRGSLAALAALAFAFAVLSPALMFSVAPALGGYALLWLVFAGRPGRFGTVGRRTDISYGLYLYAWPVQNLLVLAHPGIPPWLLVACATPLAALLGYASWTLVEKPAILLNARRPRLLAGASPG